MPATLLKPIRLANPARRRRKNASGKRRMTTKQKLFFGSKAQRKAAAKSLSGHRKRRKNAGPKSVRKTLKRLSKSYPMESVKKAGTQKRHKGVKGMWRKYYKKSRIGNVGEIITISGLNPGKKRKRRNKGVKRTKYGGSKLTNMARRKRSHTRRRRSVTTHRRRRRNPSFKALMAAARGHRRKRYSRRRRNSGVSRRRYSRRRSNPGFLQGGTLSTAFGVIGGAAVTKLIMDRLPASLSSGIVGYIVTGVVAGIQGTMVGKLFKNPTLGKNMQIGGYTYLGLKLLSDFAPNLSLPFGLRGMGIITPSSFYTPQVPMGNSMTNFVLPSAVAGAIPAPAATRAGMGRVTQMARVGRMG